MDQALTKPELSAHSTPANADPLHPRVNLHHGKIEDAIVRAVIHDNDGIKLQVDVVGLDLTALIDRRQVVD